MNVEKMIVEGHYGSRFYRNDVLELKGKKYIVVKTYKRIENNWMSIWIRELQ